MIGIYTLIVISVVNSGQSVTMHNFAGQAACEVARTVIAEKSRGRLRESLVHVECVKNG
jgi:hypothetical protein